MQQAILFILIFTLALMGSIAIGFWNVAYHVKKANKEFKKLQGMAQMERQREIKVGKIMQSRGEEN